MRFFDTLPVALLLSAALTCLADEPVTPSYEVSRIAKPIRVDGVLDADEWGRIQPVGVFRGNKDASPAIAKTEAKIAYDSEFIYFAFRCEDDNISATLKNRDEHLWKEEVVEIFIQSNPKEPGYVELQVNPLGAFLDTYVRSAGKPLDFRSWNLKRLQRAVRVTGTVDGNPGDREWTCEMAVPFSEITAGPNRPPQPGERWRVGLYRIERHPREALLAWSPTLGPSFHTPSKFGWLIFTGNTISD